MARQQHRAERSHSGAARPARRLTLVAQSLSRAALLVPLVLAGLYRWSVVPQHRALVVLLLWLAAQGVWLGLAGLFLSSAAWLVPLMRQAAGYPVRAVRVKEPGQAVQSRLLAAHLVLAQPGTAVLLLSLAALRLPLMALVGLAVCEVARVLVRVQAGPQHERAGRLALEQLVTAGLFPF